MQTNLLDAETIRRMTGPISDVQLADILLLKPSAAEMEEAMLWAEREDELGKRGHPLTGKAAAIFDILAPDEENEDP